MAREIFYRKTTTAWQYIALRIESGDYCVVLITEKPIAILQGMLIETDMSKIFRGLKIVKEKYIDQYASDADKSSEWKE